MANVVDRMIVEIGLDPTEYRAGAKNLREEDAKVREQVTKTGKEVEGQSGKASESLVGLTKGVGALFTAFTGVGIGAFLGQIVKIDAATGRSAKTLNMSTQELASWQGAAKLAGGSAESVTQGLTGLTQALETARLTGDASVGAKFSQLLGISVQDGDRIKTAAQIYLEVANKMQGMDAAKAATAGALLGIPADVIPLLIQGRARVEDLVRSVRAVGAATDEDAAAAVRFETAWTKAMQAVAGQARKLYPVGTMMANYVTSIFSKGSGWAGQSAKVQELHAKGENWEAIKQAWRELSEESPEEAKQARSQVGVGGTGAFKSQDEKESFIRTEAAKRGIDPDQAMRVARSEGFNNFQSTVIQRNGQREPSWGAFQLYTGGGLGNEFQKQTGLDPSDRKNEPETIKFALDNAAKSGWGPWHGWQGDKWAGIGRSPAGGAGGNSMSKTEVNIGAITVQTQATDAAGIARDIGPAIKRDLQAQQANDGPQ